MKTIRVDLLGEERLERETSIFIGVPDDVNEDALRELGAAFFQRLADESAADWETNDSSGIEIHDDEDGVDFTEIGGEQAVVAVLGRQADGKLGVGHRRNDIGLSSKIGGDELFVETKGIAMNDNSKELHELHLDGFSDVMVSVYQPQGGRFVCEIAIETNEHRIVLYNMHCDVAWMFRNALTKVLREFGMQ